MKDAKSSTSGESLAFHRVFAEPYRDGFQCVRVTTGVAAGSFVEHLMLRFPALCLDLTICVAPETLPTVWDHNLFVRLVRSRARCHVRYSVGPVPGETSVVWKNGEHIRAFTSARPFTWSSLEDSGPKWQSSPVPRTNIADPSLIVSCVDPDVFALVPMAFRRLEHGRVLTSAVSLLAKGKPTVVLPLVVERTGEVHQRSGLNWGQRPELSREPNQAYIPVPKRVHQNHPRFFPPRGEEFTVVTDDGETFVCVLAQSNEKALQTTRDNSILGRYFRRRLGIPLGSFVSERDLARYGRTHVSLSKLDDHTFFLDFSSMNHAKG